MLGDGRGYEVDLHVIAFDEKGNGLYGPEEKGVMYLPKEFERFKKEAD